MTALEKVRDIGPATAKRLKNAGIHSAEHLAMIETLPVLDELGSERFEELQRHARRLIFPSELMPSQEFDSGRHIRTAVRGLDKVLVGGVRTGTVTHIHGKSSSGKTTLCCQLAVRASAHGRVLWIDSGATFKPYLTRTIATRCGWNPDSVLDMIDHALAITQFDLEEIVQQMYSLLSDSEREYALLVIDSLSSIFQTEYLGLTYSLAAKRDLGRFLRRLLEIALAHDLCVVFTNGVHESIGGLYCHDQYEPDAEFVVNSLSTTVLSMRKRRRNEYRITVKKGGVGNDSIRDVSAYMGYGGFYDESDEARDIELWRTVYESSESLRLIMEEST